MTLVFIMLSGDYGIVTYINLHDDDDDDDDDDDV